MNDASWDVDELKWWSEKVNAKTEKRALDLDFDSISFTSPNVPKVSRRKTFSALETKCFDLTNKLMATKQTFLDQAGEMDAREPLMIDLDELMRFTPSRQRKSPTLESCANEAAHP